MQETFEACQEMRALIAKMEDGPHGGNAKQTAFREELLEKIKSIETRSRL